jgi:hypothetical protein
MLFVDDVVLVDKNRTRLTKVGVVEINFGDKRF